MPELAKEYSVEVDTVDKDTWYQIIHDFSDASIYQTWSYDEIRFGRKRMSHLIVKKDSNIVAAAQVRIVKIPIIKTGIAYVYWGPLWKRKNTETDTDVFRQAIRALKNEYTKRRGLLLRIYPIIFNDESDMFLPILKDEGFTATQKEISSRTLLVDLTPDLETLRKGLNQKWRNCLNRAERNNLEVIGGSSDDMYQEFISLYKSMLARKKFIEPNDINEFREIQKVLPNACKMMIMLCRFEGNLCAGAIFSAMGTTGIYLFGAMNELGMKSNGSYQMQWKFIEWLKEQKFSCYDLNGINPETNPGTYKFKAGLCGKNGKDVFSLGKFEVHGNFLCTFAIKYGEALLSIYRKKKSSFTSDKHN